MAYRRKMDMIKLHHALVNIAMNFKPVDAAIRVIKNHYTQIVKRESDPNIDKIDINKLKLKEDQLKKYGIPKMKPVTKKQSQMSLISDREDVKSIESHESITNIDKAKQFEQKFKNVILNKIEEKEAEFLKQYQQDGSWKQLYQLLEVDLILGEVYEVDH